METAIKNKPLTSATKESFTLAKGRFAPEEASELVQHLFYDEVNFQHAQSFSQWVRFSAENQDIPLKIEALKKAHQQAKALIAAAKKSGRTVQVHASISIELI
jgi:hypothetical protein